MDRSQQNTAKKLHKVNYNANVAPKDGEAEERNYIQTLENGEKYAIENGEVF